MDIRAVRLSDADGLAHVLVTTNSATYRGIVPECCLEFTQAQSATNWRRTLSHPLPASDCFLVVHDIAKTEEAGAAPLVAYAWGGLSPGDSRDEGELKQLMILPSHQRQGLGRTLVRRVADHLALQGIYRMRVEVLHLNPNRAFYERLGARYVSQRPFDWDGVVMPMCLYAWHDTRQLIECNSREE